MEGELQRLFECLGGISQFWNWVGRSWKCEHTCGRMSRFMTAHRRRNTATLSLKSHRMFCRYLVCSSSAFHGLDAVGTRKMAICSRGSS